MNLKKVQRILWRPWSLILGVAVFVSGCQWLVPQQSHVWEFYCASGDVTSHGATIWAKGQSLHPLFLQYSHDSSFESFLETELITPNMDSDYTVKFHLEDLNPNTNYQYRVVSKGKKPGPVGRFATAPIPQARASVSFVIGGDLRESYQPFTILDSIRQERPDFFLFLGDTIYADKGRTAHFLPEYWAKYVNNRDIHLQRLLSQASVYVVWDDHEVDSNFISEHPRIPVGRQAFFDYWPLRPHALDPSRMYRSFRWGKGMELFLLDTRQYRDPSKGTMLGNEQKDWLLSQLQDSSAIFKIVATSVPLSDPREDKWGEYSDERDEILEFISQHQVSNVVFLTADVHHAAIARVPGFPRIKEFIFGPLAAPMNYKVDGGDSRFEYFYGESQNFGRVSVQFEENVPTLRVEWFDKDANPLHQTVLISEKEKMVP